MMVEKEPLVTAFIFKANFTAASKNSATLAKSSSINPLDVRAGVPGAPENRNAVNTTIQVFDQNQRVKNDWRRKAYPFGYHQVPLQKHPQEQCFY